MHSEVFEVASETLVDPDVVPPFAGDQVTEPLVSEFMGRYSTDSQLVHFIGLTLFV